MANNKTKTPGSNCFRFWLRPRVRFLTATYFGQTTQDNTIKQKAHMLGPSLQMPPISAIGGD